MTFVALLILAGLATVLSGFFSGTETGIYCVNRVRLRVAAEQGHPAARRIEHLIRRPEELVIASLLGTNVADYLATVALTALFLALGSPRLAEVYATVLVTPLILVFGGVVPKEWYRRRSNELLLQTSWVLTVCVQVARALGLVWVLRGMARGLVRWLTPQQVGGPEEWLSPRTRTLHLLREGAARGGLTTFQRDLIERVLNLSEVRVADVMIPRARIAAAPVDLPRDEFLRIARMAHFSRLPVYDHDPRRIVGIVNVYDVLTDPEARPVAAHARPPLIFAPGVSVSAALVRMQRARQAMAIVADSSGHCLGILTIKDLVEELVGELEVW